MNYPMALVIGIAILGVTIVACKLIEEYFQMKRSYVENENIRLRKQLDSK